MAELKTQKNDASVHDFIQSVEDPVRRADAEELLKLFEKVTGEKATMWGAAMIGFGQYHYKSERSTQEGDWPLTAFSPRKANMTVYIMSGFAGTEELLKQLGKHKISGGSCLYIKKLADVDKDVLAKLVKAGYEEMKKRYSA